VTFVIILSIFVVIGRHCPTATSGAQRRTRITITIQRSKTKTTTTIRD